MTDDHRVGFLVAIPEPKKQHKNHYLNLKRAGKNEITDDTYTRFPIAMSDTKKQHIIVDVQPVGCEWVSSEAKAS